MIKQKPLLLSSLPLLLVFVFLGSALKLDAQKQKSNSFKNVSYGPAANVARSVSTPGVNSAGNHFVIVSLTINKADLKGKAVLEEDMSVGLAASEIISSDAKFASKNGVVTFTWKKLPENDKTINIKYQIESFSPFPDKVTLTGSLICGDKSIVIPATSFSMKFAPVADTAKKSVNIPTAMPSDNAMANVSKSKDTTGAKIPSPPATNNTPAPITTASSPPANGLITGNSKRPTLRYHVNKYGDTIISLDTVVTPTKNVTHTKTKKGKQHSDMFSIKAATDTTSAKNTEPVKTATSPTSTNPDVYYRIQIGAFMDDAKAHKMLTRYKISEEPFKEPTDNSGTRYLIGKYPDINSAKSRIEELKINGLEGAYIVPYYHDKRSTFQEVNQMLNNSQKSN